MSDHAKLSPSARHRWGACPGSVREEAKYPEPPGGPAAIDGTHSHTLLEHCVKNKLMDPLTLVGVELEDHEGKFRVDQDRALRVKDAVEYVKRRVEEETYLPLHDEGTVVLPGFTPEIFSEEKVDPSWLLRRDDLHGTVDVQIWGSKVYEIIDYKDGMGVVEVKDNPQLEQYAYGVLSRFKLNPLEPYPFDTIRMTVIQPKLAIKGMPAITSHDVKVVDLLWGAVKIQEQAALTDDPNAPLIPGEKQCKFCRAKGSCSALASNVMEEVGLMFQPVNQDPVPVFLGGSYDHLVEQYTNQGPDLAQQSANQDPGQMTDDQIRQILEAAPLVRQMLEGVEKEALRRLQAGIPVPGFKLVRGRGSRSWSLPEDQIVKKLVGMGIPKSAVYETKLVSPAQAEKLTWEKKGEKVQLSERQLKTLNTEYIAQNSGKLTIAPESDPREAIVTNAAPMFTAIPAAPEPVAQIETPVPAFLQVQTDNKPEPPKVELPAWLM